MIEFFEAIFQNLGTWGLPVLFLSLALSSFHLAFIKNIGTRMNVFWTSFAHGSQINGATFVAYFGLKFLPVVLPEFKAAFEWVPSGGVFHHRYC